MERVATAARGAQTQGCRSTALGPAASPGTLGRPAPGSAHLLRLLEANDVRRELPALLLALSLSGREAQREQVAHRVERPARGRRACQAGLGHLGQRRLVRRAGRAVRRTRRPR